MSNLIKHFAVLQPLPLIALLSGLWAHGSNPPPEDLDAGAAGQVASAFAREHRLSASPSDVHLLDSPQRLWPYQLRRAWVLAGAPGQADDVFIARALTTREGRVLGVPWVFNLTETFATSERQLVAQGDIAAWVLGDDERSYHVRIADLGRSRPLAPSMSTSQRLRWRLAWLQATGELGGVATRNIKLVPAPEQLQLRLLDESTELVADGHRVLIPKDGAPSVGAGYVAEHQSELPAPGNWVTWAVDRARAWSWLGDERMQVIKAVAYRAKDWAEQHLGLEGADTEQEEFDTQLGNAVPVVVAAGSAPATGDRAKNSAWPPKNIEPFLDPPWEGEGQWQSLANDPFTRAPEGSDTTFLTTFIRSDPERKFARTLIVLWDPGSVELHMVSGTEEPKSATGETGAGMIPREPGTLKRVVAAFNGGFQGTHGNYGMMADGVLYVPPRPFAATVATVENGETAFGTWPADSGRVPSTLTGFRQNLTPLVAAGKANPYGRMWWGGVPQGWQDDTQTVRSGLCLTHDGFIAYFYGPKIDAQHLAESMLAARCKYGMHLDMNQGHTGLEFYRVDEADALPPLAMALTPVWQAEGRLADMPGYRFRGRRLFRGMQLMNFPRYIQPQARDFFYLALRPSVPRAPDQSTDRPPPENAGELAGSQVTWDTAELEQHGVPRVISQGSLNPDPTQPEVKLHVLCLDPYRFQPTRSPASSRSIASASPDPGVLGSDADASIWWHEGRLHHSPGTKPPRQDATQLFRGSTTAAPGVAAGAGISDQGQLLYVELASGLDPSSPRLPELITRGLKLAGARPVVYLSAPSGWVVGGRDLSLHPATVPEGGLHFVRVDPSGFQEIFKGTPVVERSTWRPLQKRGFEKPKTDVSEPQPAD